MDIFRFIGIFPIYMKYTFVNYDANILKETLLRVGEKPFYDALKRCEVSLYPLKLSNLRLISCSDKDYIMLEVKYRSGWYELLKLEGVLVGKENWQMMLTYK